MNSVEKALKDMTPDELVAVFRAVDLLNDALREAGDDLGTMSFEDAEAAIRSEAGRRLERGEHIDLHDLDTVETRSGEIVLVETLRGK